MEFQLQPQVDVVHADIAWRYRHHRCDTDVGPDHPFDAGDVFAIDRLAHVPFLTHRGAKGKAQAILVRTSPLEVHMPAACSHIDALTSIVSDTHHVCQECV